MNFDTGPTMRRSSGVTVVTGEAGIVEVSSGICEK